MRQNDLLILQVAVSLTLVAVLSLLFAGCSTGNKPVARIAQCLTDPSRDMLYCDGRDLPWKQAAGYVCHSLDDHETLMEILR